MFEFSAGVWSPRRRRPLVPFLVHTLDPVLLSLARRMVAEATYRCAGQLWFAAHGITHIHRVVTDNGACYRSGDFARIVGTRTRHKPTKPFTPKHNGKVERYQRSLAEKVLYAREFSCEDDRLAAIEIRNIHYSYHRPHSTAGGRPPASRLKTGVTDLRPLYT